MSSAASRSQRRSRGDLNVIPFASVASAQTRKQSAPREVVTSVVIGPMSVPPASNPAIAETPNRMQPSRLVWVVVRS